jgi:DNA-binding CsgD family transcriptional regulator
LSLKEVLSHDDAIGIIELIGAILRCDTEEDLRKIPDLFRRLVPFDYSACALSRMKRGSIETSHIININYPDEWVDIYARNQYYEIDPVFIENFSCFRLQYWENTYRKYQAPKSFVDHATEYGLRNGYTHGMKNQRGDTGCLLSLAGSTVEHNKRTEAILDIVVPHFHQALRRIAGPHNMVGNAPLRSLSTRQREILRWLCRGKTTWDISMILGISERTVKFHVENLMRKLDVVSRAQAVAVAIEKKIIDLD